MNQTQETIELKRSSASSLFNMNNIILDRKKYQQEQELFKRKLELKIKLNKMKKRTKCLLEKHNWRKFFNEEDQLVEDSLIASNESSFNLTNNFLFNFDEAEEQSSIYTESSFISTIDFIKQTHQQQPSEQTSKLNLLSESINDLFKVVSNLSNASSSVAAACTQSMYLIYPLEEKKKEEEIKLNN